MLLVLTIMGDFNFSLLCVDFDGVSVRLFLSLRFRYD